LKINEANFFVLPIAEINQIEREQNFKNGLKALNELMASREYAETLK